MRESSRIDLSYLGVRALERMLVAREPQAIDVRFEPLVERSDRDEGRLGPGQTVGPPVVARAHRGAQKRLVGIDQRRAARGLEGRTEGDVVELQR